MNKPIYRIQQITRKSGDLLFNFYPVGIYPFLPGVRHVFIYCKAYIDNAGLIIQQPELPK